MMEWIWWLEVIALYVGSGIFSYRLMVNTWRKEWDLTVNDRRFFIVLSLFGPVSLGSALIYELMRRGADDERVVAKRYSKDRGER